MWFPAVVIRPSWYARYLQSDRMSMAAEPAQQEGRRSIRRIVVSALTAEILSIVHKDSVRFYRHILKRNIELSTRRWRLLLTGPSQSLNELLFISMVFFLSASLSLSLSLPIYFICSVIIFHPMWRMDNRAILSVKLISINPIFIFVRTTSRVYSIKYILKTSIKKNIDFNIKDC